MTDEEEQIVGVLRLCSICEAKTLHVDGVCQEHKVIRRKKRRPAPASSPPTKPRQQTKAPPKRGIFGRVLAVIVVGGLIYLFGALHIVHGDRTGLRVCWKQGWTLASTIVNSDDPATDPSVCQ